MPDAKITITAQDLATVPIDAAKTAMGGLVKGAEDLKSALTNAFTDPKAAAERLAETLANQLATGGLAAVEVSAAAAATGIGALAAAAGYAVVQFTTLGEEVLDASYKLSDTVENTAALKGAMDVAGGSIDQAANLMFKLQSALQEGGAGADKVRQGLDRLGVSADDLAAKSLSDQILMISDAFRANTDQTNRAGVAMDLFGRQGRDAIPLLMKPLSDLDAEWKANTDLTEADAKAAEELATTWRSLKESMSWAIADVGLGVVHFLQAVRDGFAMAADAGAAGGSQRDLVENMDAAQLAAKGLTPVLELTAEDLAGLNAPQVTAGKGFKDLSLTTAQADAITAGLNVTLKDVPVRLKAQEEAAKTTKKAQDDLNESMQRSSAANVQAETAMSRTVMTLDQLRNLSQGLTFDGLIPMAKGFDDATRAEASAKAAADALARSHDTLSHAMIGVLVTQPELVNSMHLTDSAVGELSDHITQRLTTALQRVPDLFIQAFTGAGGVTGALKAIGVSLLEAVTKDVLDPLMAQVASYAVGIGKAILGAFTNGGSGWGGVISSITGGLTGGGGAGVAGAITPGIIADSGGAAAGGTAGGTIAGLGASIATGLVTAGIGAALGFSIAHFNYPELTDQQQAAVNAANSAPYSMQREKDAEMANVQQNWDANHPGVPLPQTLIDDVNADFPAVIPMAAGGDFVVSRPTLFLAGEAGPERATFSGANRAGGTPTSSVAISAMHAEIKGLRSDLKLLPMMLKHALRGAR